MLLSPRELSITVGEGGAQVQPHRFNPLSTCVSPECFSPGPVREIVLGPWLHLAIASHVPLHRALPPALQATQAPGLFVWLVQERPGSLRFRVMCPKGQVLALCLQGTLWPLPALLLAEDGAPVGLLSPVPPSTGCCVPASDHCLWAALFLNPSKLGQTARAGLRRGGVGGSPWTAC